MSALMGWMMVFWEVGWRAADKVNLRKIVNFVNYTLTIPRFRHGYGNCHSVNSLSCRPANP
jgi:uncharacterized protein YciW